MEDNKEPIVYRTYKKRFLMYGIASFHMFFFYVGNHQYSSISNLVTKYYDVGYVAANFTGLFVAITKIIVFYPIGRCVDNYGIKFSLVLCGALNAFAAALKIIAVRRSWFWIIITAQIIQSTSNMFPISAMPLIGVNWFPVNEMALIIGSLLSIAAIAGVFTFIIPSTVFKNATTIHKIYMGLVEINMALSIGSFLLLLITILVVKEKPKTPPSAAGVKYQKTSDQNAPLIVILKNRNAVLLVIYHAIFMSSFLSIFITLNQAISGVFPDERGNIDVTVSGTLLNASGIIGSIIVASVIKKYPKYKLMLIALNIVNIAAVFLYGFSLWMVNAPILYSSMTAFGFVNWALMSFSMDYLLEVSFPYPSGILFAIDMATGAVPCVILTPLTTALISKYGSVIGIAFLLAITVVNSVITLFVGEDLRRRRADQEITPLMSDNSSIQSNH